MDEDDEVSALATRRRNRTEALGHHKQVPCAAADDAEGPARPTVRGQARLLVAEMATWAALTMYDEAALDRPLNFILPEPKRLYGDSQNECVSPPIINNFVFLPCASRLCHGMCMRCAALLCAPLLRRLVVRNHVCVCCNLD